MNIIIHYNDYQLIISKEAASLPDSQFIFKLSELKKEVFLETFNDFIAQKKQLQFFLVTDDSEKAFKLLKKVFVYIEAAGGVIMKQEHYLFIHRHGKWDIPKGKIDLGETSELAAIRECEEECGINKLTIINHLIDTWHIYSYKGGYALKKTYWYTMNTQFEGELVPQTEEGIDAVVWFTLDDIRTKVINDTYPSVKYLLEKHIV